ncbi:MAG: alanine racemase [Deltaproteobacteria bacterium]|nr:alanine racemase [Deltaproteobacteria bacterium]
MKKSPAPVSWVEIDLSALGENLRVITARLSAPTQVMAVVKADAYGHGLVPVARELVRLKVGALGVNSVEEGIQVRRRVSSSLPVVVLLGPRVEEAATCLDFQLTPVIYSLPVAQALSREAGKRKIMVRAHLKVDTGMGRLGVVWSDLPEFLQPLRRLKRLQITGLSSHLARADEPGEAYNRLQWQCYEQARRMVEEAGWRLTENHLANSAAAFFRSRTHLHFIRPGIMLYGGSPDGDPQRTRDLNLRPVLALKTRILQIKTLPPRLGVSYGGTYKTSRTERVAVLPVGYANGYSRHLSNQGQVLIGGRRFPVIGRVCMSLIIVRLDDRMECAVGDEAVLLGRQGDEAIQGDTLARQAGTIAYELFCLMGKLNPRIYKK